MGGPLRLREIRIYPVKGCAGTSLDSGRLDRLGLEMDRRWMVTGPDGGFLTQRDHPRLALIRPRLEEDWLVLEAPGVEPLSTPRTPGGPRAAVEVWGDAVEAVEVGEAAPWMEAVLGVSARLVYMPDDARRPTDPAFAPDAVVSFADGFPLLAASIESMAELNRRLPEPLSLNRFRPNLVVEAGEPHGEDRWRRIRIGAVELDVVKPCARCVVTTVDPASGRRSPHEPLRTLASYRRDGGKVWFGQNLVHRAPGILKVGDPVQVLESGEPRPRIELAEPGPQNE